MENELKDIPVGEWFYRHNKEEKERQYSFLKDVNGTIWVYIESFYEDETRMDEVGNTDYDHYNEIFKTWENQ